MVPHAGTGSQLWRDVVCLGAELQALEGVRGSRVHAEVAVVWDWESYWALELEWRPSVDLRFRERVDAYYQALWREHATVDFVHPAENLSAYRLVVVPSGYLLGEAAAKNLRCFVESGGHLLVSYFSGIVDEHDTVHPGAYPGALRDVLGLSVEEFHPLREHETVALSDGSSSRVWSERVRPAGAVSVADFASGPDAGHPAITRHELGNGTAWYVATSVDELRPVLARALDAAGVDRPRGLPETVEAVRRGAFLFLINHGDEPVTVPDVAGTDLLDGTGWAGEVTVPGGGVRVIATA
ncbi:beta-galactosidase trimerization domain-containing protein [Catellatospora bangladeshensis]